MDDDFEASSPRAADDRPRGVHKAKLADVDLDSKLSIFYRPDRRSAMVPLEPDFPKELAKIFCDRIEAELRHSDARSYVITGGDSASYKQIFSWIRSCIENQSIEKFPDIPEPEDDPFTPTINIILAGERLGVPAGSLSFHLKKRLNGCARKHLMPFSQVRELYDIHSETYKLDIKHIACTSIFNAWWDARLDEHETPELMEELSDIRDDIEELDESLHEACRVKEEEVRKKWEEKKAKKKAEKYGGGDEWNNAAAGVNNATGGDDWDNTGTAVAASGDWDTSAGGFTNATSPVSGEWDNPSTNNVAKTGFNDWANTAQKTTGNDWSEPTAEPAIANTWADEMNDHIQEPSHTLPVPSRW